MLDISRNRPGSTRDGFNLPNSIRVSEIGFDIDGVVADTMEAFIRLAREDFGINDLKKEEMTSYWLEECLSMPTDTVAAIIERLLTDPFGVRLEPIPGAKKVLTRFAACGRLTFVTARPIRKPIEAWMKSLLSEVPPGDINVIATGCQSAKAGVLKELGLRYFIDDHLETCQELYKEGIGAIVFDQPWNRESTPFLRIKAWQDLQNITGQVLT